MHAHDIYCRVMRKAPWPFVLLLSTPIEPFFRNLTVEREFTNGVRSESYQIGVVGGVVGGVDRTRGDKWIAHHRDERQTVRRDSGVSRRGC